jgi:hypothetical protein
LGGADSDSENLLKRSLNVEISETFFFGEFFFDHFQGVREKDDFFLGMGIVGEKKREIFALPIDADGGIGD